MQGMSGKKPGTKSAFRPADQTQSKRALCSPIGFPDRPCMKKVYKDKKRDGPLSSAYQPVVNRPLCSSIDLNGISLVRASGGTFRRCVFDVLKGMRDAYLLGEMFCRRPVLPGLAPLLRYAPRPDLPVVCPGFGFDKYKRLRLFVLLKSRPKSCRRFLEGKRVRCFRGEQTRRRPDPPRPAPPRRPAVCCPDPTCPWYIRVLDSTNQRLFPDMLHEQKLQRQKGDGPLVSSQEHRALLAPRINCLSTGFQPVRFSTGRCVSPSV